MEDAHLNGGTACRTTAGSFRWHKGSFRLVLAMHRTRSACFVYIPFYTFYIDMEMIDSYAFLFVNTCISVLYVV